MTIERDKELHVRTFSPEDARRFAEQPPKAKVRLVSNEEDDKGRREYAVEIVEGGFEYMGEVKHTKLPWRVVDRQDAPLRNIKIAAGEVFVAEIDGVPTRDRMLYNRKDHPAGWTDEQASAQDALASANAAFIVQACNAYAADQKKIAALTDVVRLASKIKLFGSVENAEARDAARAALKLAGEK